MYRDQKGRDPAVEDIDGKPYLRASTGHARYGTLEIRGAGRFLFLENIGFLHAVYETLPYWGAVKFPAAYRPMHEIMSAVSIKPQSHTLEIRAKAIELHLDADCIITMDHSKHIVSMSVANFAIQALNHFAESRLLDISVHDMIFIQNLKLRWEGAGDRIHAAVA